KSIPSRMPRLAWAVTRTVVSPTDTSTAPSAWGARRPVEKVRDLPVSPMGADAEIGPVMELLLSSLFIRAAGGRFLVGMLRANFRNSVGGWQLTTDAAAAYNGSRSGGPLLEGCYRRRPSLAMSARY